MPQYSRRQCKSSLAGHRWGSALVITAQVLPPGLPFFRVWLCSSPICAAATKQTCSGLVGCIRNRRCSCRLRLVSLRSALIVLSAGKKSALRQ